MIDINNIINTAIQQEINKAITNYVDAYMADVQQESRRQIEALKIEIEQLKQQRADNPATGADTTLAQEVKVLLENNAAIKQAVYEIAYSAAESVLGDHTEEYSHDEYDRIVNFVDDDLPSEFPDFDYFVRVDSLEDAIRDAISIDDFVKEDDLDDKIEEKVNDLVDVDTLVTKDDMYDAVRNEVRDAVENRVSVSLTLC